MARLNEAALAAENIEAIHRRYVRQNHELAKANTMLAQRLRSMQCEQARWQVENSELREINLQLQAHLAAYEDNATLSLVDRAKQELQSKLDEMSAFVAGLDILATRPRERTAYMVREPRYRFAARPMSLLPVDENGSNDTRDLPETAEDVLDPIFRLPDQSVESVPPQIPVFVDSMIPSPVLDQQTSPRLDPYADEVIKSPSAECSVNLQVRRRRKDLTFRAGKRRSSPVTERESDGEENIIDRLTKQLSLQDDGPINAGIEDDFIYHARTAEPVSAEDIVVEATEANEHEPPEQITLKPPRPALGEKSVNVSPRKAAVASKPVIARTMQDENDNNDLGKDIDSEKTPRMALRTVRKQSIKAKRQSYDMPVKKLSPVVDIVLSPVRDKKPLERVETAATEVQPETATAEDAVEFTPDAVGDNSMRPSRRARASVSYAEPSLNSKMRRPTQELVDAVCTTRKSIDAKSVRTSISASQRTSDASIPDTTAVSREPQIKDDPVAAPPSADTLTLMKPHLSKFRRSTPSMMSHDATSVSPDNTRMQITRGKSLDGLESSLASTPTSRSSIASPALTNSERRRGSRMSNPDVARQSAIVG